SRLEIFDDDVRSFGKLAHNAPAVFGFEVHRDRALAAIASMVVGGTELLTVNAGHEGRPPSAGIVTSARPFDLDDVGAEVSQDLTCPRSCQHAGQLQNAQAR